MTYSFSAILIKNTTVCKTWDYGLLLRKRSFLLILLKTLEGSMKYNKWTWKSTTSKKTLTTSHARIISVSSARESSYKRTTITIWGKLDTKLQLVPRVSCPSPSLPIFPNPPTSYFLFMSLVSSARPRRYKPSPTSWGVLWDAESPAQFKAILIVLLFTATLYNLNWSQLPGNNS